MISIIDNEKWIMDNYLSFRKKRIELEEIY